MIKELSAEVYMKISNERYEVKFTLNGGEMTSFYDNQEQLEYLWQGDDAYWKGKNPTLFPLVGNTYGGKYQINDQSYSMKNHGLIRYATLSLKKQTPTRLVMELDSSEETLAQYPFPFHYEISYILEGNKISIEYNITNTGDCEMPFTFGLHPGFNTPLLEGERFEDYKLIFDQEEDAKQMVFDPEANKPYELKDVHFKELPLNYDEIQKYETLVYKDLKSKNVTLQGPKHGVRMSIADYPYFAVWTIKKGAPFVCLEPWYGIGDLYDVKVAFDKREGMLSLSPSKTFTTSYSITLL